VYYYRFAMQNDFFNRKCVGSCARRRAAACARPRRRAALRFRAAACAPAPAPRPALLSAPRRILHRFSRLFLGVMVIKMLEKGARA